MILYVLYQEHDEGHSSVLGVFTTPEKANEAAEKVEAATRPDSCFFEAYTLDALNADALNL